MPKVLQREKTRTPEEEELPEAGQTTEENLDGAETVADKPLVENQEKAESQDVEILDVRNLLGLPKDASVERIRMELRNVDFLKPTRERNQEKMEIIHELYQEVFGEGGGNSEDQANEKILDILDQEHTDPIKKIEREEMNKKSKDVLKSGILGKKPPVEQKEKLTTQETADEDHYNRRNLGENILEQSELEKLKWENKGKIKKSKVEKNPVVGQDRPFGEGILDQVGNKQEVEVPLPDTALPKPESNIAAEVSDAESLENQLIKLDEEIKDRKNSLNRGLANGWNTSVVKGALSKQREKLVGQLKELGVDYESSKSGAPLTMPENKIETEVPKEEALKDNSPIKDESLKEVEAYLDKDPAVEKVEKKLLGIVEKATIIFNELQAKGLDSDVALLKKHLDPKERGKKLTEKRVEYLKKQCLAVMEIAQERSVILKEMKLPNKKKLAELGSKILMEDVKAKMKEMQADNKVEPETPVTTIKEEKPKVEEKPEKQKRPVTTIEPAPEKVPLPAPEILVDANRLVDANGKVLSFLEPEVIEPNNDGEALKTAREELDKVFDDETPKEPEGLIGKTVNEFKEAKNEVLKAGTKEFWSEAGRRSKKNIKKTWSWNPLNWFKPAVAESEEMDENQEEVPKPRVDVKKPEVKTPSPQVSQEAENIFAPPKPEIVIPDDASIFALPGDKEKGVIVDEVPRKVSEKTPENIGQKTSGKIDNTKQEKGGNSVDVPKGVAQELIDLGFDLGSAKETRGLGFRPQKLIRIMKKDKTGELVVPKENLKEELEKEIKRLKEKQ